MQSSGASLFSYLLAQKPQSLAIIDLWSPNPAPKLCVELDVVLKATVCSLVGLHERLVNYHPTLKILFVRNPVDNYLSLDIKHYRDHGGIAEDKFLKFEEIYKNRANLFDFTVYYEDMIRSPDRVIATLNNYGWPLAQNAYKFKRTLDEILMFNQTHSVWCKRYYGVRWGCGNIHVSVPVNDNGEVENTKLAFNRVSTIVPDDKWQSGAVRFHGKENTTRSVLSLAPKMKRLCPTIMWQYEKCSKGKLL